MHRRAAAQSRAGLSPQTFVIVVACVAVVGAVVLFLIFLRVVRSCRSRRNAVPLPPIQPLAHQREHQLAQFEASIRDDSAFLAPRPPRSSQFGSLSARGSDTSLLGSVSTPHTSYTPTGDGSEDLAILTPLEPESPLPARHPSFHTPTPPSSSTNLSDSAPTSSPNTPTPSSVPSSFSRQSKSLSRLNRDDQSRPHHHRPLSVSSSFSRSNSRRGLPHAPNSQVQVILPAPLAPGLAPTSSLYDPDLPSERMSIVDQWVPAGRDSVAFLSTAPRTPRRASSNPNSMTTGPQINHRQYPSMPDVGRQHVPPVPRVPSIYGQTADSERDKGRNLNKRVA